MKALITLKFGFGNQITKSIDVPVTIGTLVDDMNTQAVLGYGDKVQFVVNGVVVGRDFVLSGDAMVLIEDRVSEKQ